MRRHWTPVVLSASLLPLLGNFFFSILDVSAGLFVNNRASSLAVLSSSGCCDKVPWAEWLIGNRNLFLTVLEAGSPKSGTRVVGP